MRQSDRNQKSKKPVETSGSRRGHGWARGFATALSLLLGLCLLFSGSAAASYESVGVFGNSTPAVGEPGGVAVNETGAGGVPVGTVYSVNVVQDLGTESGGLVLSYTAQGAFREAWGWGVADESYEFERCGPAGEVAHPTCKTPHNGTPPGFPGEGVGQIDQPEGVAVDQATGDVYVFNGNRKTGAVQVFTAAGEPVGGFGENAANSEQSIATSPEQFHHTFEHGRIAVDGAGDVYVADYANRVSGAEGRVMVFKPQSPNDYKDYVYTGHAADIGFSTSSPYTKGRVATDDAGDVYVANNEFVSEFLPGETAAPACRYKLPGAQLAGMAVNTKTGEVFVISFSDFKFRQLAACNEQSNWKFVEKGTFPSVTKLPGNFVLAFDAALGYGSSRPPGILYFQAKQVEEATSWNMEVYAPAEIRAPQVVSESVASVDATSAVLGAQIDPEGSQTSYVFQYLTLAAYEANGPGDRFAGAVETPLGGAQLGSGQKALSVSASVSGLRPDTAYRFRVLASSLCNPEEEGVPCPAGGVVAEGFRTYPFESATLPDRRAYELVSPIDKAGGQVFQLEPNLGCSECNQLEKDPFPKQASANGEAVVFEGTAFSTSGGGRKENEYVSRRTPSGWQTSNLTPERLETGEYETGFRAFDANLENGLLTGVTPSLTVDAPSEYANLYSFSSNDPGSLSPLLSQEPQNRSPSFGENSLHITYAGASAGLSHVLFEANAAYTPETPFAPAAVDGGSKANNLYEEIGGMLRLVNVLPGNTETVPGATFGAGDLYHPSLERQHAQYAFDHAISDDGSRIFWSNAAGQLYVRENGEVTREIPDHTGKYLTAATDGSKVLLSDGVVYDLDTDTPIDLTEGKGGFQGVVGQSDNLTSIYFVDSAVIGSGAENEHGETARPGAFNLYLNREGNTFYIATLQAGDDNLDSVAEPEYVGDWHVGAGYRSAESSPDGRYLAFMSRASLTGVNSTSGNCHKFENATACEEVFLYDSQTGRLACPSCNPTERPPLGSSALPVNNVHSFFRAAQRYLTDSGRLYFDSGDSLSSFDTNAGYEDVYQYEPEGVGSCERAGGCVRLISAGSQPTDSTFLDTDESGANVFFTTRDRLVPKDHDDLVDLYDARENGGFANETEGTSSECQGEACQPSQQTPSSSVAPASLNFEGPGDLTPSLSTAPASKPAAKKKTTGARGLQAALKRCKVMRSKKQRSACEKTARRRYAPKNAKKSTHTTANERGR